MRKWLALALVMALMAILPAAAHAVDDKLASVALVLQIDETVEDSEVQVVGMAVLVQAKDGETWITPSAIVPTNAGGDPVISTYLLTEDGMVAFVTAAQPLGSCGISVLSIQGQLEPVAAPIAYDMGNPESQAVVGYLEDGTMISGGANRVALCQMDDGSTGMTLTAMKGLKPGSATYDRDGRLTGMILASLGEGEGRYLAVSAMTIYALLNDIPASAPAPMIPSPASSAEELLSTEIEGGYLIVTPVGMETPTDQEAAVYYMDAGNIYYSWVVSKVGADSLDFTLPAVPGRTLMIWFAAGNTEHGAEELEDLMMNQDPLIVSVPEAAPIDRYEYQQECYLAALPTGTAVGDTERLDPITSFSAEMLVDASYDLYFQVNSSYSIPEDLEESLLVCLFTPDGSCLTNIAGFYWGVDFMAQDDWHVNVTELFSYYAETYEGTLPAGEYTLSYYIGSDWAGSYTFTLSDSSLLDEGGEL